MLKKDFLWLLHHTKKPVRVFVTSTVKGAHSVCLRGTKFPDQLPGGPRLTKAGTKCQLELVVGSRTKAYRIRDKYAGWMATACKEE